MGGRHGRDTATKTSTGAGVEHSRCSGSRQHRVGADRRLDLFALLAFVVAGLQTGKGRTFRFGIRGLKKRWALAPEELISKFNDIRKEQHHGTSRTRQYSHPG